MKQSLFLSLLLASGFASAAHYPTLLLMGGSYRTCSSLDTDDCKARLREFHGARQTAQYRVDAKAFVEILDPGYWASRDRPPTPARIKAMLETALAKAGNRRFSAADLAELFKAVDAGTWNTLLVLEQDMILSAFEVPQFSKGVRLKEGVAIDGSASGHDAEMFRRLVREAAKRSPGKRPRIAFTTSAANNNFDAVDFYRNLLLQAGAEPVWWPVDWSMNAALFGQQGCQALPLLRQRLFSQIGRERVFPDLAAQQAAACADPEALAELPGAVNGVFLDGGDQWLHWNTFFDADGQPNLWLLNLRSAFQRGELVVAGTSAGTAVQSGPAMITNGSSANALLRGAKQYGSMPEGCERAKRCPQDLQEDDLSYWPGGGLGLAGKLLMDTHVSERKRELRLITLLNAVEATAGIGIDETSTVLLQFDAAAVSVEALGMSGAWWLMKPSAQGKSGAVSLTAHYLAPGLVLQWRDGQLSAPNALRFSGGKTGNSSPADALQSHALRDAVWRMAAGNESAALLHAQGRQIRITASPESRHWQGPDGQQGITGLRVDISGE